jgi:hypothetical protein
LVGIDKYADPEIPSPRGAVNDVKALKRLLIDKYGFQERDIKLLTDGDATREAIVQAFTELVGKAREEPALFYFAGNGSFLGSRYRLPAIVSVDGRQPQVPDIQLVGMVGGVPSNLVTVVDAGWAEGHKLPWGALSGSRFVSPRAGRRPLMRDIQLAPLETVEPEWKPDAEWMQLRDRTTAELQSLGLGRVFLCNASIQGLFGGIRGLGGEATVEAEFPLLDGSEEKAVHGALTYHLLKAMREADPTNLTYAQLIQSISQELKWLSPFAVGEHLDENVFSNSLKEAKVQELITQRITQEPFRHACRILQRLMERRKGADPEAHLNLGIAHASLGDYDKSIAQLEAAVEQHGEQEYPEARYHLGRAFFESGGDLDRAVSELRRAKQHDPDIVPAYYYLGQAIRARIEREALVEAEQALKNYLDKGAPLGHREEVQQFLGLPEAERPSR